VGDTEPASQFGAVRFVGLFQWDASGFDVHQFGLVLCHASDGPSRPPCASRARPPGHTCLPVQWAVQAAEIQRRWSQASSIDQLWRIGGSDSRMACP